MQILAEASGGSGQAEFFSTHPNPYYRIDEIKKTIKELYPNSLSSGLKK